MKDVGLNLYSIRNFLKTEESFLATAIKLKEMGYSHMQYSGGPFDPEMIKRVSEASGMPVVLTHVPFDRIVNDTDALMADHAVFGCKNIGLGSIPISKLVKDDKVCDVEKCKETLEQLNKTGEYMASKGYRFFLHNHHYEFMKMETGETIFDYILENAPFINFTLDTYWLQVGGVNVIETIEKLKGRIGCVHLKDYRIVVDTKLDYFDCKTAYEAVGDGNMNFKAIVPKLKEAGTEYFIVEHDSAANLPDPMLPVERSIRYIQNEL